MGKTFACALYLCAAIALSSCGGGADPAASLPQRAGAQALAAAAQVPPPLDATGLMDWAEGVFPSFFPGHLPNKALGPFVYRGPYSSGNYVGLGGDVIYIMGTITGGNVPVAVGTLGQFTCRVLPQNCMSAGSRVRGTVIGKGTPLAGATVTLRDIAGIVRSTTTGGSGTYTIDASNLAPPLVVTASGTTTSGTPTQMVSVGRLAGGLQDARINVTPLTTLLAGMLSPTGRAGDLDAARDRSLINGSLTVVTTYTVTLLTPSLTDAGFDPIGFDPISAQLDAGDAMTRLLAGLTIGTTPGGANFMAPSSASPCAPAQVGSCVTYSDPGTQTTTNPNVCGFDIATGAPIPCDSSLPLNAVPPPISINVNQAYNFGCSGCVFFGPADNYAAPPVQPPLPSVITVVTATWFAHFSATACVEGICVSGAQTTSITGTAFEAQAACLQAGQTVLAILSSAAIPGFSYSFTCTQSP